MLLGEWVLTPKEVTMTSRVGKLSRKAELIVRGILTYWGTISEVREGLRELIKDAGLYLLPGIKYNIVVRELDLLNYDIGAWRKSESGKTIQDRIIRRLNFINRLIASDEETVQNIANQEILQIKAEEEGRAKAEVLRAELEAQRQAELSTTPPPLKTEGEDEVKKPFPYVWLIAIGGLAIAGYLVLRKKKTQG